MGHSNIFLVGMMGAGKTTVGRALASRLKREFVDTDRVLVDRTGVPVATVFEIEGEEGFRRRESGVLEELCAEDGRVVPMDELRPRVGHALQCAGHELLVGHRACRLTARGRGWES